jgi:succinate dehydrogenase / fumarate reductase membrane anchor subunit
MNFSSMRTERAKVSGLGSAKSGTGHFWQQRLTALANVPLALGFIWLVLSSLSKDYAGVKASFGSPLGALLLLLFVGSGVYHMRLGMQVIIEDYVHGEGLKVATLIANTFFAVLVAGASILAILKLSFAV